MLTRVSRIGCQLLPEPNRPDLLDQGKEIKRIPALRYLAIADPHPTDTCCRGYADPWSMPWISLVLLISLQSPPAFSPAELQVQAKLKQVGGSMMWVIPDERESREEWVLSVDIENKGKMFDCAVLEPVKRLYALRILGGDTLRKSLEVLPKLPNLGLLVVTGTGFTDADLKHLGKCRALNKLDFGGETISRTGLSRIAGVRTLRRLFLYNTKIKDADLAPLKSMSFLDQLVLPKTVTVDGLNTLSQKLRRTQVSRI